MTPAERKRRAHARERGALAIADAHDDPRCSCSACAYAARVREAQRRQEDARTHGGLRADFVSLVGGIDL